MNCLVFMEDLVMYDVYLVEADGCWYDWDVRDGLEIGGEYGSYEEAVMALLAYGFEAEYIAPKGWLP